jgi:hypothetical protein
VVADVAACGNEVSAQTSTTIVAEIIGKIPG